MISRSQLRSVQARGPDSAPRIVLGEGKPCARCSGGALCPACSTYPYMYSTTRSTVCLRSHSIIRDRGSTVSRTVRIPIDPGATRALQGLRAAPTALTHLTHPRLTRNWRNVRNPNRPPSLKSPTLLQLALRAEIGKKKKKRPRMDPQTDACASLHTARTLRPRVDLRNNGILWSARRNALLRAHMKTCTRTQTACPNEAPRVLCVVCGGGGASAGAWAQFNSINPPAFVPVCS